MRGNTLPERPKSAHELQTIDVEDHQRIDSEMATTSGWKSELSHMNQQGSRDSYGSEREVVERGNLAAHSREFFGSEANMTSSYLDSGDKLNAEEVEYVLHRREIRRVKTKDPERKRRASSAPRHRSSDWDHLRLDLKGNATLFARAKRFRSRSPPSSNRRPQLIDFVSLHSLPSSASYSYHDDTTDDPIEDMIIQKRFKLDISQSSLQVGVSDDDDDITIGGQVTDEAKVGRESTLIDPVQVSDRSHQSVCHSSLVNDSSKNSPGAPVKAAEKRVRIDRDPRSQGNLSRDVSLEKGEQSLKIEKEEESTWIDYDELNLKQSEIDYEELLASGTIGDLLPGAIPSAAMAASNTFEEIFAEMLRYATKSIIETNLRESRPDDWVLLTSAGGSYDDQLSDSLPSSPDHTSVGNIVSRIIITQYLTHHLPDNFDLDYKKSQFIEYEASEGYSCLASPAFASDIITFRYDTQNSLQQLIISKNLAERHPDNFICIEYV